MAGIPELKRSSRAAGSIDVDKADVRRFREFADERVDDLAVGGRDAARWNGRDVIAPQGLPITAGLQEHIHAFGKLEEADEVPQMLRGTVRRRPGDVTFGEDTEGVFVEVFGGLTVALARSSRCQASSPGREAKWARLPIPRRGSPGLEWTRWGPIVGTGRRSPVTRTAEWERARSLAGDDAAEDLFLTVLTHAHVLLAATGIGDAEWPDRMKADYVDRIPSSGTGVWGPHELALGPMRPWSAGT